MLVEDPEEVEKEKFFVKLISKKHAKKLEYSTKSPKKLARLSKESKNPSSNQLRLYLIKPPKKLTRLSRKSKKPSSNCLSRLWRPEKFFVRGRSKTLDCL